MKKQKADSNGDILPNELVFFQISQLKKELNEQNDKVHSSFP
jgi:hypothetical protein